MDNRDISKVLEKIADLLELKEANFFRIRAYRNAAWAIADHPTPLSQMLEEEKDLTELDFIGKDLAVAIKELVSTGRLAALDELEKEVPPTLLGIKRIPGLGPKKARKLWRDLDILDVPGLEKAALDGRIADLAGFGEKTQESILRRINRAREKGTPYEEI